MKRTDKVFKALGSRRRREIVGLLSREVLSTTEVAGSVGVSHQLATQHLEILNEAGLVEKISKGKMSYWVYVRGSVQVALRELREMCNESLGIGAEAPIGVDLWRTRDWEDGVCGDAWREATVGGFGWWGEDGSDVEG